MILEGDCLSKVEEISSDSIQTVVTSPPYWGLRDYDNDGQLGQESSPEKFVFKLTQLFSKIKNVLKDDGTVWVNIGVTFLELKVDIVIVIIVLLTMKLALNIDNEEKHHQNMNT